MKNAVVIVEGTRIKAIGGPIPAGAEVIDLGDVTLLPGFIDAHTHLSFESGENYYREYFEGLMRHPAEQALLATTYARKTIEAGVTTVRDVGSGDYIDISLRNAIAAGHIVGPRMLVAVHSISATGGHGDSDAIPPSVGIAQHGPIDGICNGADECRAAVRYQIKFGADVIKAMPSGGVLSLADPVDTPQLTRDEMNAIVEEAHLWGRKVAAHCHGDVAAKIAIAAGVDSIEHGTFLQPDTLALMRDKGIYLVPTLLAAESIKPRLDSFPLSIATKARAAIASRDTLFRNALKAGVKIAFGTDSAVSAPRPQRPRVLPHDQPRHAPRRRPPHHHQQRRPPRPRRPPRHHRGRQTRRHHRRPRQPAHRHDRDGASVVRDEGRGDREALNPARNAEGESGAGLPLAQELPMNALTLEPLLRDATIKAIDSVAKKLTEAEKAAESKVIRLLRYWNQMEPAEKEHAVGIAIATVTTVVTAIIAMRT